LSISCRFVVDLLVVQQIEPMEFEPTQPTTIADSRREAVYIAQWSIACEGYRRAVAIGLSLLVDYITSIQGGPAKVRQLNIFTGNITLVTFECIR